MHLKADVKQNCVADSESIEYESEDAPVFDAVEKAIRGVIEHDELHCCGEQSLNEATKDLVIWMDTLVDSAEGQQDQHAESSEHKVRHFRASSSNFVLVNVVFTEEVKTSDPHEGGAIDVRRRVAEFHVFAIFHIDCPVYH